MGLFEASFKPVLKMKLFIPCRFPHDELALIYRFNAMPEYRGVCHNLLPFLDHSQWVIAGYQPITYMLLPALAPILNGIPG
jgi:hypothetical protein